MAKLKYHSSSYGTLTSFGYFSHINLIFNQDWFPHRIVREGRGNWFNNQINPLNVKWFGCFDPYWRNYNPSVKFFFSHCIYPNWYGKVVEEFNETFNNIKIDIIDEKNFYTKEFRTQGWDGKIDEYLIVDKSGNIEFKTALITLELNKRYSEATTKKLKYFIHHFMRMLHIGEGNYLRSDEKDPGKNYLQFVLDINNRALDSRALAEEYMDLDIFSLIDNIDISNKALGSSGTKKQTSIYTGLKFLYDSKKKRPLTDKELTAMTFKIGDTITGKESAGNRYYVTTRDSILKVIEIFNPEQIRVEVISHRVYSEEPGHRYDVDPRFFEKVNIKTASLDESVREFVEGEQ